MEREEAIEVAVRRWMASTGEQDEQVARQEVTGSLAGTQLLLAVQVEDLAVELSRHWLGRRVSDFIGWLGRWGEPDGEAGPGSVGAAEERLDLLDGAHPPRVVSRVGLVAGSGGGWWRVAWVAVCVDRTGDPGQLAEPIHNSG